MKVDERIEGRNSARKLIYPEIEILQLREISEIGDRPMKKGEWIESEQSTRDEKHGRRTQHKPVKELDLRPETEWEFEKRVSSLWKKESE